MSSDSERIGSEANEIRSSLLRALLLLMFVLCCAIFGVRLFYAYSDVDDLSQSLIEAKTDLIEAELHRFFAPARFGMGVAREWGRSGLLPIDDPLASNPLLMPFLADNDLVSAVIIGDTTGRESMLLRQDEGWLNKLIGLEEFGTVRHLSWSRQGQPIGESRTPSTYDPRTRRWFIGAMELDDASAVHWTEPYRFHTTQESGITSSTRFEGADSRQYVVAFDVALRDISRFTAALEVSPRGRALVIDEGGQVVGLPRDERFDDGDEVGDALLKQAPELGIPEVTNAVAKRPMGDAGEPSLFPFRVDGETWRAGFRRYYLAPTRHLSIAVVVPESDLLGDLVAQRNQFLASTALGLIGAVLVALLLDRIIRQRLERVVSRQRRVGQYTLEHEIGRGGMGEVYRARHTMLRRPTAIKLLGEHDAASIERFEREVQLTSQLTHPNTIAIFDYGRTPEGRFYYAMEHLPGITLQTLVERFGPVPAARAIAILRQVCGSLAEAHAKGLVHRDVKPQNIMLCERGGRNDIVKVLDFGLVKDLAVREDDEVTAQDAITGSPLFISPEAVRGAETVESRSDIYSLGAVAYWLLTGKTVFEGGNAWKVCLQHLHEKPERPSERVDFPIPEDLEGVVMDCLRKHPENRPANAVELEKRLAACSDAGAWSEDDARQWFHDHAVELEDLLDARPLSADDARPRRLSIDLRDRMGGASGAVTQKRAGPR
jgi:serine/threonine protein kinase